MKSINFRSRTLSFASLVVLMFLPLNGNCQSNSNGQTPQFLFEEFTIGKVKMKNGSSQKIELNYNMVSEKMVYRKEGKLYDVINVELIDSVYVQNSVFTPVEGIFYEVLYIAPMPLFVKYKGSIIPPGAPAGYGGTSQVSNTKSWASVELSSGRYNLSLPSDYTVNVDKIYWVIIDGKMNSFINERQFLKLFSNMEDDLKKYIKKNRIKFDKESNVVKLITYCNELKK